MKRKTLPIDPRTAKDKYVGSLLRHIQYPNLFAIVLSVDIGANYATSTHYITIYLMTDDQRLINNCPKYYNKLPLSMEYDIFQRYYELTS